MHRAQTMVDQVTLLDHYYICWTTGALGRAYCRNLMHCSLLLRTPARTGEVVRLQQCFEDSTPGDYRLCRLAS